MRITYNNRRDSKTTAPPKPIPAWVTAHYLGNLERKAQAEGSSAGWRVPFQVPQLIYTSSTRQLNLFVSAAFRQLDLAETDSEKFVLLTYVWGRAPTTPISFRDFWKVF